MTSPLSRLCSCLVVWQAAPQWSWDVWNWRHKIQLLVWWPSTAAQLHYCQWLVCFLLVFLHLLTCFCLVFQMENAQPRKPKYENGTGKKKASRLSVYIKCLSDSRLCLVARGNGIVSHRCMGPGSPAPASVANTGYVYNWPTACR